MTTPVTELLNTHFRDLLLAPPVDKTGADIQPAPPAARHEGLSIVYVSSNVDEQAMNDYLRPNGMALPFATSGLRIEKGSHAGWSALRSIFTETSLYLWFVKLMSVVYARAK
jgi:hypothetical protein